MENHHKIAALIVTFRPELESLRGLIDALASQVDILILVDNGTGPVFCSWLKHFSSVHLKPILLPGNNGLAAAQNIGIAEARRLGMDYVLLSDQDSLPAKDMVAKLLVAIRDAQSAGQRPAAAGPRYEDIHQGRLRPFVRISNFRTMRFECTRTDEVFKVDHLISSGSLIPISVLDEIGTMNEQLFIDYIDTEWCLRAWRRGYCLLGVCNATMRHRLGDKPNYFFGRYVPVHEPLRHYYLMRNAVWLLGHQSMPLGWRIATLKRLVLVFAYFTLIGPQRTSQARMMLKGLYDGLLGKMGKLPN